MQHEESSEQAKKMLADVKRLYHVYKQAVMHFHEKDQMKGHDLKLLVRRVRVSRKPCQPK